MLSFYILCIIGQSVDIFQNCRKYTINEECYRYKNSNFILSCSNQFYQTNHAFNPNQLERISSLILSGYSEIEISCLNINNNRFPNIYIFDQPKIHFVGCSYYNANITIFGSPTLTSSENLTIKFVKLYNKNYNFPFKYDNIITDTNTMNETLSFYYYCNNTLKIKMSEKTEIACQSGSYDLDSIFYLNYENYRYFNLAMTNNKYVLELINEDVKTENVQKYFNQVITRLITPNLDVVHFIYIKPQIILETVESFYPRNINIREDRLCYEININDSPVLKEAVEKDGWRKICYHKKGYIFYKGKSEGEIIVIPSHSKFIIITFLILLIFVIFISLCLIAFCKYKKDNKNNNSEEEFINDESEI